MADAFLVEVVDISDLDIKVQVRVKEEAISRMIEPVWIIWDAIDKKHSTVRQNGDVGRLVLKGSSNEYFLTLTEQNEKVCYKISPQQKGLARMPSVNLDAFIIAKKEQLATLAETRQVKNYLELQAFIGELEALRETILSEGDTIPEVKEKKLRAPRRQAKMPDLDNGASRIPSVKITSTPAANFDPTLEESAE